MHPEIGSVLEGKVTGVTKFGAFVALPEGGSGLVHISEIANTFVSDISQFVQVGQPVTVKVIKITDDGKINLSIKQAAAPVQDRIRPDHQAARSYVPAAPAETRQARPAAYAPAPPVSAGQVPSEDQDFEERLKKFMKDSDSRIADSKYYQDRGKRSRRK